MAFGQTSGPPATRRQLDELLALVNRAGFDDFREARHPLGLTQRQANGKFTRDEADAFIEQLMADAEGDGPDDGRGPGDRDVLREAPGRASAPARRAPVTTAERTAAAQAAQARKLPPEILAAELQRRGWAVIEP